MLFSNSFLFFFSVWYSIFFPLSLSLFRQSKTLLIHWSSMKTAWLCVCTMRPKSSINANPLSTHQSESRREGKVIYKPIQTCQYPNISTPSGVRMLYINTNTSKDGGWQEQNITIQFCTHKTALSKFDGFNMDTYIGYIRFACSKSLIYFILIL